MTKTDNPFSAYIDDNKFSIGKRSYNIFTKVKKQLSPKLKQLVKAKLLPPPKGFRLVNGRIVQYDPDRIYARDLNLKVALREGFPTLKALKEFITRTQKNAKIKITRYSQLQEFKSNPKIKFINKYKDSEFVEKLNTSLDLKNKIKLVKNVDKKSSLGLMTSVFKIDLQDLMINITKDNYRDVLINMFKRICYQVIQRYRLEANDFLRLTIESPDIESSGQWRGGNFRVSDLSQGIEDYLDHFEQLIMSAQEISNVDVIVNAVDIPQGMGSRRNKNMVSFHEAYEKKCGIFHIDTETHCGFMAVACSPPVSRMLIKDNIQRQKLTKIDPSRNAFRMKTAKELMKQCGIDENEQITDWLHFDAMSKQLNVCIHIFDETSNKWLHTDNIQDVPNDDHHHVYLYKVRNHFDLIKEPKNFFQYPYICHKCEIGYNHNSHTCDENKNCHNIKELYHKRKYPSECQHCKKPRKVVRSYIDKDTQEKRDFYEAHRCCTNCKEDITGSVHSHKCFMTKGKVKVVRMMDENGNKYLETRVDTDLKRNDNLVVFDFEAMTDKDGNHIVNYCVSQYLDGTTHQHTTIKDFIDFVFKKDDDDKFIHKDYTFLAHYGSGYDFKLIYEYIFKHHHEDQVPYAIFNGEKITSLTFRKANIRFIDTYRFFLQSLEKLPKTYGFKEMKKGFFPHRFNKIENQYYIEKIPDISYYDPDNMMQEKRKEFEAWYATQVHASQPVVFDFQKEMKEYCINDVDILRKAVIKFREYYMDSIEDCDPFQKTTLPAFTLALYRSKFMPENSIAVFNKAEDNQSKIALEWLKYNEVIHNKHIHTVLDGREAQIKVGGGERRLISKLVKVDGYIESTKTVFEFSGCKFHGCPKCFPKEKKLLEETLKRNNTIKNSGYTLHHIWECEWKEQRKDSAVIEEIMPLEPRDAFYGGRTEVFKHRMDITRSAKKRYRIYYRDITSLYPYVMFYKYFPIGHPEIIRHNFDYTLQSYFGLVKCRIVPPKDLYIPVLPRKTANGKLAFALGNSFSGTWTTEELNRALQRGYVIDKIYEVHHFKEKSNMLFKDYISHFLKIKQEASGYPSWVNTEKDKDDYIQLYYEKMGIRLDKEKIIENDGLRACAKLCLNNLWGRFGMRTFKDKTEIVRSQSDFLKIFTNKDVDRSTISFQLFEGADDVALVSYETFEDTNKCWETVNPYIAVFTASYARLKLLDALETLGDKIIYCDTDSVIYYAEGNGENINIDKDGSIIHGLQCGDMLGDFTDELNGHWIKSFAGESPKSYAFKVAKKKSCSDNCKYCNKTVCKVKGFTLNSGNEKVINFNSLSDLVVKACLEDTFTTLEASNFRIGYNNKTNGLQSRIEKKIFSFGSDKRDINKDTMIPYFIDTKPLCI